MNTIGSSYKKALVNWLLVYPLITFLLWLLNPLIATWPLPGRTLLITALVVPIMSFGALPMAFHLQRLIQKKFTATNTRNQ